MTSIKHVDLNIRLLLSIFICYNTELRFCRKSLSLTSESTVFICSYLQYITHPKDSFILNTSAASAATQTTQGVPCSDLLLLSINLSYFVQFPMGARRRIDILDSARCLGKQQRLHCLRWVWTSSKQQHIYTTWRKPWNRRWSCCDIIFTTTQTLRYQLSEEEDR